MQDKIISLKGVKKVYETGDTTITALNSPDLELNKGELTLIMGPSGSGKTTLLSIVGCVIYPTEGEVYFLDKKITDLNENELARIRLQQIGFVFQQFNLLPRLTAAENVALPLVYAGMGKKERLEKALYVLEKVSLADRSHHRPNEMSGGQNQRVAIARALVNDPSIILADEPTGNLDTKTSHEIMDIFGKIHDGGNTVVLVTHEEDIANHAHRIIRLRDGVLESDRQTQRAQAAVTT